MSHCVTQFLHSPTAQSGLMRSLWREVRGRTDISPGEQRGSVVTGARRAYWREQLNRLRKDLPAGICPICSKINWRRELLILLGAVAISFAGLWYVVQHEQSARASCPSVQIGARYADCLTAFQHEDDRPDLPQP
jgi:hypothetical protein